MNMYLNKILKREKMKRISLVILGFFLVFNLHAEENMGNIDKLDMLDKQSKEFFNAITGLEKNYLEEQINAIKNKKVDPLQASQSPSQGPGIQKEEIKLSQEDYEKNVFTHQNEMAKITTDFTRTKQLKDLKIKSMYSFNKKDYVVLELIEEKAKAKINELSANIEGRYIEGDSVLGHKIMNINTRTKSVELYKQLDEEYGYRIYLSNYGISVGDLEKIIVKVDKKNAEKEKEEAKNTLKEEAKKEIKEDLLIKKAFDKVETKPTKLNNEEVLNCLYTVKKENLNVRNSSVENARIMRVLKLNDQFTIKRKNGDWAQIETIYKKISGDVMDVSNENNWIQILENTVTNPNKNCM